MADKIENKQVAEKQQDNSLSNLAFELMKSAVGGAAAGAAAGAMMNKEVRDAAVGGIVGGAAGMAAAEAARRGATEAGVAGVLAGAGGAIGVGAGIVGKEIIKENKTEIQKGAKLIENEVKRQVQEMKDTPKDVVDHVQKRPVTSIVEGVILGPGAVILDAKLRKWFGDK